MTISKNLSTSGMYITYDRGNAKVCLILCIIYSISNTFVVRIWSSLLKQRCFFFSTFGHVMASIRNISEKFRRKSAYDYFQESVGFKNVYFLWPWTPLDLIDSLYHLQHIKYIRSPHLELITKTKLFFLQHAWTFDGVTSVYKREVLQEIGIWLFPRMCPLRESTLLMTVETPRSVWFFVSSPAYQIHL
jgi:hypothetical protein